MQLHSRRRKDANFISTVALAQAGASTTAFDLGQVQGGIVEGLQIEVSVPAVAGISNSSVLTFTLQDSADGSSWLPVDPAVTTTVTGAGGTGTPAKAVDFPLPPAARRFVRVAQTASASAGTFSGSVAVALLF